MRTTFLLMCLALCLGVASTGCVTEPRNGAVVGTSRFTVSGFVPAGGQSIRTQLWNNKTQQWLDWGSTTTSATSATSTDCKQTSWFAFTNSLLVPRSINLYEPSPFSTRHNIMRVQSLVGPNRVPLATFETNAESCAQQFCGGNDAINQCKSPISPMLLVQVPCGAEGQACCMNGVSGCEGNLLCNTTFECRAPNWLTASQIQIRTDAPTNRTQDWTDEVQGLTTDGTSWFVPQSAGLFATRMWKVPYRTGWGDFSGSPVTITPHMLCEHWGDPDVHEGIVYLPLENCGAIGHQIAAYKASDLAHLGNQPTGTAHAAWTAINPVDGRLYVSDAFDEVTTIKSFKVSHNPFRLSDPITLKLYAKNGSNWVERPAIRVQGGAFSSSGKLYLAEDTEDLGDGRVSGYHVGAKGAFKMVEFFMPIDFGTGEEVEGIEIHPAGESWGEIHVMVLDNDTGILGDQDSAFLKHYKVADPNKL